MSRNIEWTKVLKVIPLAVLGSTLGCTAAFAGDDGSADSEGGGLKLSGYARGWMSFNLQNQPDTPNYNDQWKVSMQRLSISVNADTKIGATAWHANVRSDQELLGSYEKQLQASVRQNMPGGPGSDLVREYRQTELREFYGEGNLGDRVFLRVGKQQVVWGETDFFHPTDLIHGFDYRWRSFLEGESDELRKPLILLNAKINVPEAAGGLQVIVRPGLDRAEDIGNTYMLSGGRWMITPNKGVDFLALTRKDSDHPSGAYQDVTGGLRWTGLAGPINYSASWLRTFKPDAVLNPAANPYLKTPTGALGDWFNPVINVYSGSVSGEVGAIDAVLNAEVSLHKNSLFNSGLASNGFAGPVVKKDVVQTTLRVDKQARLQEWLGTNGPSLASLQVFDTWIRNYNKADEIVENVGYTHGMREHNTIATFFISLPFMNSNLTPGIAIGRYIQARDTFVIPSVSYNVGNHWRFSAEADLFFAKHYDRPGVTDPNTGGLGVLGKMSQLMLRATYQF